MTTQHFDSSVLKKTKDGRIVLSTYLEEGEELAHADTTQPLTGGLRSGEGLPNSTMTLDASMTNTIAGEDKNPKPSEDKIELDAQSGGEPDNTPADDDKSGDSTTAAGDNAPIKPKGADKREWYDYAKAVDSDFDAEYEDVTQKQLAEKYGK